MTEQELLKHLMEFFPVVGQVVGRQELKYNMIMKYSDLPKDEQKEKLEALDGLIEKLKDKGVLNQFEFKDTVNYKAKKEIPVSLGGGGASTPSVPDAETSGQMAALSDLVVALAENSDDSNIQSLLDSYKENYQ